MTGLRHLHGLNDRGLLGLAGSISYLLANAQPHFSSFFQCLCLVRFFATLDGCATFNDLADLTAFGVAVNFNCGVPN
jgi:hypothetical protein